MMWIGLSGGLGCGKSTSAQIIRDFGYKVIDADQIVHHLYSNDKVLQDLIANEISAAVITPEGVDRKALKRFLDEEPASKNILEAIVHPRVQEEVKRQRNLHIKNNEQIVFYDVPLLFENNLESTFDKTIFISAPLNQIYKRLEARSGWSVEEVNQRLKWLWPNEKKEKLADYVIYNDATINDLKKQIESLLKILTKNKDSQP